jgi:arginine decarboxylase
MAAEKVERTMRTRNLAQTPYIDALRAYADLERVPFHVPGHLQGRGASAELHELFGPRMLEVDLCSGIGNLDGWPGSALDHAQALAADAYGADRSWFLINGSTSGNQIMLASTCHPGDVVLTSRNTHKSIISALVVSGARPVYLRPELDPVSHIAHGVTPATVAEALDRHPEARAVLITSPTYYGACSDLVAIAEVAHAHGVPLLVDEAWGPHFPFHPELPAPAMVQGADMSVTGAHKLLGALTQASMLHARDGLVDGDRVEVVARMFQSTSPSCLLYASLDGARHQMATEGEALLAQAISLAEDARLTLNAHPRLSVLDKRLIGTYGVAAIDPTRLCVKVTATGHTGYEVERLVAEEHGVVVEMADFANVLANVTIGHQRDHVEQLCEALAAVADRLHDPGPDPAGFLERGIGVPPEQVCSPAEAFHARQERVPLSEAAERVSAELAATYPPGIPVVVPGERLTPALVEHLRAQVSAGCRIVGPEDARLATIRVVRE